MYTLQDLQRLKPLLSIAGIAGVIGMQTDTLHKRLYRGSPALSEQEGQRIAEALRPKTTASNGKVRADEQAAIEAACSNLGISRNTFMRRAILFHLARHGTMLPGRETKEQVERST